MKKTHTNIWIQNVQMYEENTHTNVWKKQAFKWMTKTCIQTRIQMYEKTRIQTRIQMYEKNTHTNVWKKHAYKHAYKCMKKQMYEKNTHTNTHTNVWKNTHTNVWKKHAYKIAYKFMKKTGIQMVWQGGKLPRLQLSAHQSFFWAVSEDWTAYPLVIGRPHSPLRHGRPKYKIAYKCMEKTRTNVLKQHAHKCMEKTLIYWSGGQPITAPRDYGGTLPFPRAPQLWRG